jgi:uncharacterized protein (TIGR02266 family)
MTKRGIKQGAEKRIYPRNVLRTKVIFEDESGEGFVYFYSTDISLGGIFLESDIPLKIGTRVFLSFTLRETERPIRATAQVMRVERAASDDLPVLGMGIQFTDLPEESKQRILDFIGTVPD